MREGCRALAAPLARCRGPALLVVTLSVSLAPGTRPPGTPAKLMKAFRDSPALGLPSLGPAPQGPREWGAGAPQGWPPTF